MSALRINVGTTSALIETVTEPVTDSVSGNLPRIKRVTSVSCHRCYQPIRDDEVVYRPLGGGWEGSYCEHCGPLQAGGRWRVVYGEKRECPCCGRGFYVQRYSRRSYCSETCEAAVRRRRRALTGIVSCESCESQFAQTRKDQRHCSSKCKQRAYRARKSV